MSERLEGAPVGAAVDPVSATGELAATGAAVRRGVSPLLIPGWLMAGLRDFIRAPVPSLLVGGACVGLSWLLSVAILFTDYGVLILPLTAGFMFAAPILAVGLYEASRRHEAGEPVGVGTTRAAWRRNRFGIAFMAALLMMFLYGWLRVATMLFALFFGLELPPLGNFLQTAFFTPEHRDFALLGTSVGAVLAAIVFGLSAFSLPMLVDRPVDPVTAAATSMRACLANRLLALCWAATIVGLTLAAAAPAFLGFLVVLPVLGHATWHAYRAVVAPEG